MVSHFNLHIPDDVQCETSFDMLICHLYIYFGEVSVKVFGPFLIRLFVLSLSFKYSFENIFSQSMKSLEKSKSSHPLDIFFTEQKF